MRHLPRAGTVGSQPRRRTGISPGNRDRIFTPFFTTTREQGGTGMGLTITANLLAAHGAGIALMPSDHGAAFALTFPG